MDFRYARPPPPSSDPHQPPPPPQQQQALPPPGPWYSGQFQYHSPSPPPPQWPPQPQHSDHHAQPPPPPPPPPYAAAAPPPPVPYSSYSLPPRPPHMSQPPPQPHYAPVNQEWNNAGWGHQGWDYSARNQNEDDLAARARAWAASKAVTDDQHQQSQAMPPHRPEEMIYQDQYSQNMDPSYQEFQQHSLPPSSYQQYPSYAPPPRPPANQLQEPSSFSSGYASDGHFSYAARDGTLRESAAAYPHQEIAPTSLSVHQQEVPSSYSSAAGKEEPSDTNGGFYQPSHMPFASAAQHQFQPSVSSNDRPNSVEPPHYAFNNSSADSTAELSNQPLDFGPGYGHDHVSFGQSAASGMPYSSMPPVHATGPQADPSVGVPSPVSMHSGPLFGGVTGSSFQQTISSANTSFPISNAFHATNAFHGDTYGTHGFPERPKKASVPNWLREEIIKKKAVIGSSAPEVPRQDTGSTEDEDMDKKGNQAEGKSMESSRFTEDEDDDEDYVEAAKTAAINKEIKRILTEVLLKVTDELFDEIATKVLDEDDVNVEVEHKSNASTDTTSAPITPKSSAKVIIPSKIIGTDDDASGKSNSSSPGDVLGLGSYASDDDDEDKEVQNVSLTSSNGSKPPVLLAENGSSQVDNGDMHGKKLLEECHGVTPNRDLGNHNDSSGGEKIKPDGTDVSKLKPSVTKDVNAENILLDDSKGGSARNGQDKSDKDKKHNKVDESSRVHDDRHAKRAKKEDQNDAKEKAKDRDSGKRASKGEIKDDKRERDRDRRSNDKEDSRKLDRGKDDKTERPKYRPGDSSRHKRRHSRSPGGMGRSSKDNSSVGHVYGSSDSSSDDSKRKGRSKRRHSSPSPVRSRRERRRSRSRSRR
uniref:SH3 and multiple ankyrin repeat domains protein 1 isoform X2 n=1 Tax=Erigeron canadensis TaxID=72917 RepID=UPI001CB8E190|nr:SH3 and multiple ankyrin repeat domains protein 1 isoform X2 [Erigeron canadensis]